MFKQGVTPVALGTAYLEFGCLTSSKGGTFVQETIVYGVVPILLIGLVFLGSLVWSRFGSSREVRQMEATPWEQAKSSALGVGTLVLFLLQPTLVKRTALVMSCVQMGKNVEDVFLSEDLAIQCWYVHLCGCCAHTSTHLYALTRETTTHTLCFHWHAHARAP